MSRKYPDQTKREAIGIRQIHDDISFTRDATAARERTLRHWRHQLRKKQNSYMSEKTFQSDINRTFAPRPTVSIDATLGAKEI